VKRDLKNLGITKELSLGRRQRKLLGQDNCAPVANCSLAMKGSTPRNRQGSQSTQERVCLGGPNVPPLFWYFIVYIANGYDNSPSLVLPGPRCHAQHDTRVAEDPSVK
jgi:hypothetical protein